MAEQKINIQIVVDDKGSVVFKQFGKNAEESLGGMAKKSGSFTSMIKAHWLEITAASASVYAAIRSLDTAFELVEMGAKAQQAEESFRLMAQSAGESADKIIRSMRQVTAETIDSSDLMQKAAKGLAQGLSGDDLIAISAAARVAARLSGEDVKSAYESITDAVANQMPRALKRYGLATKEQISLVNQLMAAGVQDVKMMDIVLANLADRQARFGEMTDNSAEKIQRFKAEMHDLKEEVGKGLLTVLSDAVDLMKQFQGLSGDSTVVNLVRLLAQLRSPGEFATRVQTEGWGKALSPKAPEQTESGVASLEGERESFWVNQQMRDQLNAIKNAKLYAELLKDIDASRIKVLESNAQREVEITKMRTGDELYAEEVALAKKREINDAYYKYRLGEIAAEADARAKSEKDFDRSYFEKAQGGKLDADMKARRVEESNLKLIIEERNYARELTFEQESMNMAVENENKMRKDTIDRLTEIAAIDQRRRDAEIDHALAMAGLRGRYGENGPGDLVRLNYLAQENKLLSERLRLADEIRENDERLKPGMEGWEDWAKQKPGKNAAIAQIDRDISYIKTQSEKAMIEFGDDWRAGMLTGFKVYGKQIGSEFQIWEQFAKDAAQGMQNAMSDYFFDAITGKFQSFTDFMTNIGRAWGRALSDAMAKETMKMIMGSGSEASLFSQFASFGLGLLGGGGSGGGMGAPDYSFGDNEFLTWEGRAEGGPVTAKRPYWVGERGIRELFVPETNGTIVPQAALAGGSQTNLTIPIAISVPGLSKKQISQLRRELEETNHRTVQRYIEKAM